MAKQTETDEPRLTPANEKALSWIKPRLHILFNQDGNSGGALAYLPGLPCCLWSTDGGKTYAAIGANMDTGEQLFIGGSPQAATFDARLLNITDKNTWLTWSNDAGGQWRVLWGKHNAPYTSAQNRYDYVRRVCEIFGLEMPKLQHGAPSGMRLVTMAELRRIEATRAY